jgi:branched-chain amino acid transport system ATP-binding protein
MTDETPQERKKASGYHVGGVDSVISVEEVTRQAAAIAEDISLEQLDALANNEPHVSIKNLVAGYGQMEILHNLDLRVAKAQSLCLIGPNGAGKSTILHAIFGFNRIFSGSIEIASDNGMRDVTRMTPNQKLAEAGIAYILQDKSIFPNMTVEENLWMGGFLKNKRRGRPRTWCSTSTTASPRAASTRPGYCQAVSVACSRFRVHW